MAGRTPPTTPFRNERPSRAVGALVIGRAGAAAGTRSLTRWNGEHPATDRAFDDGTDHWASLEPTPGEPPSMLMIEAEPVRPHNRDVTRALAVLGLRVQG